MDAEARKRLRRLAVNAVEKHAGFPRKFSSSERNVAWIELGESASLILLALDALNAAEKRLAELDDDCAHRFAVVNGLPGLEACIDCGKVISL